MALGETEPPRGQGHQYLNGHLHGLEIPGVLQPERNRGELRWRRG